MNAYDAIVIGAGHAGLEAAHALARKGHGTLLLCLSLNGIGFMPCNPNVGGTAKGHIVREIDSLGGVMGKIADEATIQTRMLNASNGAAVQSLRNQVDKDKYRRLMKRLAECTENLTVLEEEAAEITVENGTVTGVITELNKKISARAVVICTGVYLDSKIIIGDYSRNSGPQGFRRSERLTKSLISLGLPIRRFKTGTPARVAFQSVDVTKMTEQRGDENIYPFSALTDGEVRNEAKCYLTYTNERTHKIILDNLHRSPLYNGAIKGVGPRYCPSIEDKVVRFKDKERHQIFVEPEGEDTYEMYVSGLSTSLPYDVQEEMIHSIEGLENAKILRYGYAIEYDCLDPRCLTPALAVKTIKGLFTAGQINGSSGYEEAAGQGLAAGLNAALYLEGKPPAIFDRANSYIGVLIDDLVTKGTEEPYRMMTSRAEHRLTLRQDNAEERLTEWGAKHGLIDDLRMNIYKKRQENKKAIRKLLKKRYAPSACKTAFEKRNEPLPKSSVSGEEIFKRGTLDADALIEIDESFKSVDKLLLTQIGTEIKYEGYLNKQNSALKEMRRLEDHAIPSDIDYSKIASLRIEARQKLEKVRPLTLAQASRISGVNPADITVLMLYLK